MPSEAVAAAHEHGKNYGNYGTWGCANKSLVETLSEMTLKEVSRKRFMVYVKCTHNYTVRCTWRSNHWSFAEVANLPPK